MLIRKTILLVKLIWATTGSANDSLNVRSLFNWDDPTIPIRYQFFDDQYNDVWGYAANGREYAFLGSTIGVHVFDVTEPLAQVLIGYYDTCTEPNSPDFRGAWGVYPYLPSGNLLVSDMQTGLWVLSVDQITDIQDQLTTPSFRVSPTITNDQVRISPLSEMNGTIYLQVQGTDGKVLTSTTQILNGPFELDLSNFAAGIYLVNVQNAHHTYTTRVVKQHR